jgi:ABC-type dipeptide/oligopeptide/nickel transport system permease component
VGPAVIARVAERLAASIGVVFGALTLIFLILNWLPGDPAALIAGDGAAPETIEHVRAQLGLGRPVGVRYVEYLRGLAHGDLGASYTTREPVARRLAQQLPATAGLVAAASLIAIVAGVFLGVVSALKRGTWIERWIQFVTVSLFAIPPFWLGLLMILVFSVRLRWLPVIGDGGFLPSVLPVATLGIFVSVPLMRMVRQGLLEGLHDPYVTTLRAKGLGEREIFFVHILRNALIATVTLFSVIVGELLSGVVVIETLFARQGIGRLAVDAIGQKDIPVVQGAILLASTVFVVMNLIVDLVYPLIDPRTTLAPAGGAR